MSPNGQLCAKVLHKLIAPSSGVHNYNTRFVCLKRELIQTSVQCPELTMAFQDLHLWPPEFGEALPPCQPNVIFLSSSTIIFTLIIYITVFLYR